jgi:hypothetical protein
MTSSIPFSIHLTINGIMNSYLLYLVSFCLPQNWSGFGIFRSYFLILVHVTWWLLECVWFLKLACVSCTLGYYVSSHLRVRCVWSHLPGFCHCLTIHPGIRLASSLCCRPGKIWLPFVQAARSVPCVLVWGHWDLLCVSPGISIGALYQKLGQHHSLADYQGLWLVSCLLVMTVYQAHPIWYFNLTLLVPPIGCLSSC